MKVMITKGTLIGAISAIALSSAPALAQYESRPFIDNTVQQSQARAFELAGLRLDVAEALPGETDDDLLEQIEGLEGDFARFGGTLAATDADLADALDEAFEAVVAAVESGSDASAAIAEARKLLAEAYDVVIAAEDRAVPAFNGALLTDILLGEPGVAEGYEEAAEEPYAFSMGWAALARAKTIWEEIAADASEAHRADGEEMLNFIATLYPSAEPPEQFNGNPEEAEAPAHRLVGIIEAIVDADLYPGRDQGSLAAHLAEVTAGACEAYGAGNDAVAAESIYAVYALYDDNLVRLTNLFDPDLTERIETIFGGLIEADDDDDDDAGEGDDEAAENSVVPASDTCAELIEALGQVRTVLGG